MNNMKSVPIQKIVIKDGFYECIWKCLLMGPCMMDNVHQALSETDRAGFIDSMKTNAKWILEACGLPEGDQDYSYKQVAGTNVGLVQVRSAEVFVCVSQ